MFSRSSNNCCRLFPLKQFNQIPMFIRIIKGILFWLQRHFCQFTSNNQNTILTICHFQFFQTFDKHQSSSSLKRLRKWACPNFNSPVIQYQVRLSTILRTSDAYHLSNSSCGYVLTLLTISVHACFFSHKTFILSMLARRPMG